MYIIIKNNKNNMKIYLDNFLYKLNKKTQKTQILPTLQNRRKK